MDFHLGQVSQQDISIPTLLRDTPHVPGVCAYSQKEETALLSFFLGARRLDGWAMWRLLTTLVLWI
jgi:hypothetical protein